MPAAIRQQPLDSPSPDRRQRRSAELRERLFRAALTLFAKKGFTETTVEDITNAADVGKGTFFNYFPSKDHILIAFSDMQIAKLQDGVHQVRDSREPMTSFLRALSVRLSAEPGRSPDVVRALLQANLASDTIRAAMRKNYLRGHALLTELMQVAQERKEFRQDIPAAELAHVFRQTVLGTLLVWSVFGDTLLPERIDAALNVLWTGMRPRAGVTSAAR
ncbi:MAG TPA: TetR/AcrR family transcriptional regulator [Candidatus Eisenbacteria bacterium]|jgi:AcrR family transcriptional regulator|nr:TetR/AcrR family transcriptional regulator [Candidatus Eisenbacteria bacterium]